VAHEALGRRQGEERGGAQLVIDAMANSPQLKTVGELCKSPNSERPALCYVTAFTFNASMMLVGRQEGHLACKKLGRWFVGVVTV